MSHELHYTSVPKGLKPGSRGFSVVAQTSGISGVLADRLENLSGYRQVYPPHDPNADRNPACRSHLLLNLGGQVVSVLSRVGFAGLDYTDRSNVYAHHVAITPSERPEAGPAWLAGRPDFLETAWKGEPRAIDPGRTPPCGDRPAAVCKCWQSQTGDAGWAGALAETFLANPRKVVYLIVPIELDPLPMLEEALALVPPERRWDVTFSTYFTSLPPGTACAWRCVLAGSPESAQARRSPDALVIDLTRPLEQAQGGPIVEQARTGIAPPGPGPEAARVQPRDEPEPSESISESGYDLIPELPPPMPVGGAARVVPRRSGRSSTRRPSTMTYQFAGLLAACAALLIVGVWLVQHFVRGPAREHIPAVEVALNDLESHGSPEDAGRNEASKSDTGKSDASKSEPSKAEDTGKSEAGKSKDTDKSEAGKPDAGKSESSKSGDAGKSAASKSGDAGKSEDTGKSETSNPTPTHKVLKYWDLPRRVVSEVGGGADRKTTYTAERPVSGLRLIGMNDVPIHDQRLMTREGSDGRSLQVIQAAGTGSTLGPGNDETRFGDFKWEDRTIEFTLDPNVRDPALLTAFLDCVLEVQAEGGPSEYVFLTDPNALARERSDSEVKGAFSLPDSIQNKNNKDPDDIPFDKQGVFETARKHQAALGKSNRVLTLIACKFHPASRPPDTPPFPPPHQLSFPPWGNGVLELTSEKGKENGGLSWPGKVGKEPQITVLIDERSGHLKSKFIPSPLDAQNNYDAQLTTYMNSANRIAKLQYKAKRDRLSQQEASEIKELEAKQPDAEERLAKYKAINFFSNCVIQSAIEITVGFEAEGEWFVLPPIRSPRLSAPGGG